MIDRSRSRRRDTFLRVDTSLEEDRGLDERLDVGLDVDDEDFGGRRSDVCRVSAKKIDGGGSKIFVRIVVEAVDVLKVAEDD